MRLPVEWLSDYVSTSANAAQIGETLTMLGIELEEIHTSEIGPVLDLKVTPNRGDCLSVLGIARELCAKDINIYQPTVLLIDAIKGWPQNDENTPVEGIEVRIEDAELCPRYAARVLEGVTNGASSQKIQRRLTAAGMRPISLLVDLSNYVMLELGQPLHAFDLNNVGGNQIVVRRAKAGEKLTTLDAVERKLDDQMLMICDGNGPVAVAGVMGGENSECTPDTKTILLESAHFDPQSVRATRKKLGLNTEASYRFERFVDPEGVVRALNRFAMLLVSESNATLRPGVTDIYPQRHEFKQISVRSERWNKLLGMHVPDASAASILQMLGCTVSQTENAITATVPSWRSDLVREDDLVEEIGRVWGYDRIPEQLPQGSTTLGGPSQMTALIAKSREILLRSGFTEVLNHTLEAPSSLDIQCERVVLRTPGSSEMSHLRSSVLPGIVRAASRNRVKNACLFEVGNVFHHKFEFTMLGFFATGALSDEHWSSKPLGVADFFFAKGLIEQFSIRLGRQVEFTDGTDSRFHPFRQAVAKVGDREWGHFGVLGNDICDAFDVPRGSIAGELDLNDILLSPSSSDRYIPISHFPSARRDIAFLIDASIPFTEIEAAIMSSAPSELEKVWLFDRFTGKNLPEGKVSLAIALVFRHPERTLTDGEGNAMRDQVVAAISKLGGVVR